MLITDKSWVMRLLFGGGSTFHKGQNKGLGPKNVTAITRPTNFTLDSGGEFMPWPENTPEWIKRAYRHRTVVADMSPLKQYLIDFAWLSHSHFDHAAGIPLLEQYFRSNQSKIYASPHTLDIIRKVYMDTVNQSPYVYAPINGIMGVSDSLNRRQVLELGRQEITPDVHLTTGIAGHILGATYGIFEIKDGPTILDTGDIAFFDQPLVPGSTLIEDILHDRVPIPDIIVGTDFTNPSTEKFHWQPIADEFGTRIERYLEQEKTVIIGGFENSRTQNVAETLRAHGIRSIYIDGGGREIYDIYKKYSGQWCSIYPTINTDGIEYITSRDHREQVLSSKGGKVIITTAGMFDGGPMETYLAYGLSREDFVFIATSYVAQSSKAAMLLEATKENPNPIVRIAGEEKQVRAKIERAHFTAHSNVLDFVRIVKTIYEKNDHRKVQIFMTHGMRRTKVQVKEMLSEYADCIIVKHGRSYDIFKNGGHGYTIDPMVMRIAT